MSEPEYEVVIPTTGRVILTTPFRNRAVAHAKHKAREFGVLVVEEVQRIEQRRKVWTARQAVPA
jgi:hypothetical protein